MERGRSPKLTKENSRYEGLVIPVRPVDIRPCPHNEDRQADQRGLSQPSPAVTVDPQSRQNGSRGKNDLLDCHGSSPNRWSSLTGYPSLACDISGIVKPAFPVSGAIDNYSVDTKRARSFLGQRYFAT